MKNQSQAVTTGIEVLKTVAGVAVGRYACVMGAKVLKINEEADPKKAKMKKIAVGGGVLAVGVLGAIKAPNDYKSVFAGISTAGALGAVTPFAKEDAGFIPALHGALGTATIEDEDDEAIVRELNSPMEYDDVLDQEEAEDQDYDSKLASLEDAEYEDMSSEIN